MTEAACSSAITSRPRGRYKYKVDDWIVAEVLPFGQFKAISKKDFDKAVKIAKKTPFIGGAIRAWMTLTGEPPAKNNSDVVCEHRPRANL
jgi:hypothetical protein